jgi:TRAP-type C4-dicarboxylate transport system permease small subunit
LVRILAKIDHAAATVEKTLVVLLFAVLILSTVVNIAARNLFDRSFQQILEFTPVMVLWLALLGSTLALKYGRHIRLELLLRHVDSRLRKPARRAGCLFGAVVTGILFWSSVSFVQNEIGIFGSRGWTAAIFPMFFALATFRYLLGAAGLAAADAPANPGSGGGRSRMQ